MLVNAYAFKGEAVARKRGKLKPIGTLIAALKTTVKYQDVVAKAGLLPFVIISCVFFLVPYAILTGHFTVAFKVAVPILIGAPLIGYFAVPLHRAVLLGDRAVNLFRFGKAEFLYALMILFFSAPSLMQSLSLGSDPLWMFLLQGLAALFALILIVFYVYLPAIAIGDKELGLPGVWRGLKGNWLRFFAFLSVLEVMVLSIFFVIVKMNGIILSIFLPGAVTVENVPRLISLSQDGLIFFSINLIISLMLVGTIMLGIAFNAIGLSLVYASIRKSVQRDQ